MDFEELMAKLEEAEGFGTEALDAIKNRIGKANNEAKNLRKRLKEAESKSKTNPVLDILKENGLEIDEDSDVSEVTKEFIDSLKNSSTSTSVSDITKNSDYIKMQKKLDKVMKMHEEAEKAAAQAKAEGQKTKIENALQANFSEDISNGKTVLNLLINSNKNPFCIDDNGDIGFKLSDGEIITGTKEIVEEYKKLHPSQVKNKSKSGVDSKSFNSGTAVVPKKFTNIEQVKALSAEQINKLSPEAHAQMMSVVAENTKEN